MTTKGGVEAQKNMQPLEDHALGGGRPRAATALRVEALFHQEQQIICRHTDRLFAGLMLLQWLAAIATALWISPRTWAGQYSQTHPHVWAALFLGGAVTSLPVFLALTRPGSTTTRHTIAVGQMLMSALLIHLTGGRIETHFHVFGSLAFLAFYRDWRVLVTASAVVAIDHVVRGIYWPLSIYGVAAGGQWRWIEHAGWVVFEDIFLVWYSAAAVRHMGTMAERQAQLEAVTDTIEQTVLARTAELQRVSDELQRAKDAAEAANRAKSEFLANPPRGHPATRSARR